MWTLTLCRGECVFVIPNAQRLHPDLAIAPSRVVNAAVVSQQRKLLDRCRLVIGVDSSLGSLASRRIFRSFLLDGGRYRALYRSSKRQWMGCAHKFYSKSLASWGVVTQTHIHNFYLFLSSDTEIVLVDTLHRPKALVLSLGFSSLVRRHIAASFNFGMRAWCVWHTFAVSRHAI